MVKFLAKAGGASAVIVALYAAFGYFGFEPLAKWALTEKLPPLISGREVSVDSIGFNPWTLSVTVDGLVVQSLRREDGHMVSLRHGEASLSLRSLTEFAPVLRSLSVNGCQLNLTKNDPNVVETRESSGKFYRKVSKLPGFSVSNISVANSGLRFTSPHEGIDFALKDIELELPLLSTLNGGSGLPDSVPRLSMTIDGVPVRASGIAVGERSELRLQFAGVDAAKLLQAMPLSLPFTVRGASAGADLLLAYSRGGQKKCTGMTISGNTWLEGIDLRGKGALAKIAIQRAEAAIGSINLTGHTVAISEVNVDGPRFIFVIPKDGSDRKDAGAAGDAPQVEAEAEHRWTWSVAEANVTGGSAVFSDPAAGKDAVIEVRNIEASADALSPTGEGSYRLVAEAAGAPLVSEGTISPAENSVKGSVQLSGVLLETANPWLESVSGAAFEKGTASISGKFALNRRNADSWNTSLNGSLMLRDVRSRSSSGREIFSCEAASAEGVSVSSLNPLDISVELLTVEKTSPRLRRRAGRVLGFLGELAAAAGKSEAAEKLGDLEQSLEKVEMRGLAWSGGRLTMKGKSAGDLLPDLTLEGINGLLSGAR